MDQLQTRLDTLEQRTHTVERQLRWWRGLAGGLLVLAVLTWALPSGIAQEDSVANDEKEKKPLEQRVAALESLLKHFSRQGNEVTITGANLHLVNGLDSTDCVDEQAQEIPDCPNGLGNLIVGYNEPRGEDQDIRTGSHNVVVGLLHNFSSVGGLVVGIYNTISGDFAVVSGGESNTASGYAAAVSGGESNTASGSVDSVSGGVFNTASGGSATISGGGSNTASGDFAVVSGGGNNTASGLGAVVSGGGSDPDPFSQEGAGNRASGIGATVSGGKRNIASGDFSSISGGQKITQETEFGWSAGSEADEVVVGNFRSP